MAKTNWERYFGSPETTFETLKTECGGRLDCYECPLPGKPPCVWNYEAFENGELLKWLKGEHHEDHS